MAIQRNGGVQIGGSSTQVGQPSTPPSVRPDVAGFRVPFDRDKFTMLIASHGYDVIWEKATLCPFIRGPGPKDHDITCVECNNGWMYYAPTETRMHIQSLGLEQQYFAYGHFESGRAQITAYPEMRVSFWDRITLVNSRARMTDRVKRQRDGLRDRPKFDPIAIDDLRWATGAKTYATAVQDVDFTIDEATGEIVWVTDNRPGADTWYSIVYFFRPQYVVMDMAHHIRDQPIPLPNGTSDQSWEFPIQVVAQLDRFIRDEARDPSSESDVTNPFPTQGSSRWQGA